MKHYIVQIYSFLHTVITILLIPVDIILFLFIFLIYYGHFRDLFLNESDPINKIINSLMEKIDNFRIHARIIFILIVAAIIIL